ncbi:MAG: hypothetical protein RLZZ422_1487 [Pseudomonadota bacterium]|jgi:hypothetical protein
MSDLVIREGTRLANNKHKDQLVKDFKELSFFYPVAAVASFLASLFFVLNISIGGRWDWSLWTVNDWAGVTFAVLGCVAITAGEYFLYRSGVLNPWILLLKAVLISFNLSTEIFNMMEREDVTVRARSESSAVYQATVNQINQPVVVSSNNGLEQAHSRKAKAEYELSVCSRYKNEDQRVRCVRIETGNVKAAEASITTLQQQEQSAAALAVEAKTKLIDKAQDLSHQDEMYNAGIKLVAEKGGVSHQSASFLLMGLLIVTFTGAFMFLGWLMNCIEYALRLKGFDTKGNSLAHESAVPVTSTASQVPVGVDYSASTSETEAQVLEKVYQNYVAESTLPTTFRPQKTWLSQQLAHYQVHKKIEDIQALISQWMERAYQEGVMIVNPDFKEGKNVPKYVRKMV